MDMKTRQRTSNVILVFFSVFLALLLCEAGLRFLPSFRANAYYVWPPYFHSILKPLPEILTGISGDSGFFINSKGIRGDDIHADPAAYNILAIGGSSTEATFLDQEEAWPFLLQKRLKDATGKEVWVGNAGKSGNTSRHHILQMKYLLPQFPDIDAIVILAGINDLTVTLSRDKDYSESEEELLTQAFSMTPIKSKNSQAFYKKTAIWQACKRIRYLIFSAGQIQDLEGRQYIEWREHRQNAAAIRSALPDISQALEEYSGNVNTIIDLAKQRGCRIIFVTQPVLWESGLSKELESLVWLGGIGNFQKEKGKEYYSVDALAKGMELYNNALLKVCRDRQVECVDLASMLPKDTTVFYDDCHFNESGSRKVSEILAQYLLQSVSQ